MAVNIVLSGNTAVEVSSMAGIQKGTVARGKEKAMGAFIDYYGTPGIPETKKEEVIRHMNAILHFGGMMGMETAEMFGHKISLITPVTYNDEGEAFFRMNYLSDEFWEDVGFRKKDCKLYSGKMGGGIFSEVLSAMYYLIELNSDEYNLVSRDGLYGSRGKYIGWINYICNASYIDEKPYTLWKAAELLHDGRKSDKDIWNIVCAISSDDTPPYSILESMYVLNDQHQRMQLFGTEEAEENNGTISIGWLVKNMKRQLDTDLVTLEEYMNYMCCSSDTIREQLKEESSPHGYLMTILLLGRKIPTKLLAEKFNCDFWTLWEKVKPYEAEPAFSKLAQENKSGDVMPEKVTTKAFLRLDDKDRLYYWTPDGDIELSDETKDWLAGLRQELNRIHDSMGTKESVLQFQRHMMRTLETMNQSFHKLFAFSSMFYEFIDHSNETYYQAAIQLLDQMMERQREKCLTYQKKHGKDWEYDYYVQDQSKEIKRYLAVLSNTELRNQYLWCQ